MKKTIFTTELKVGITVIFAIFILIFGIIWGKGFQLQTNKYQIQIIFDNVGGMVPGDPVTVNGVKEGKVLRINWQGRKVLCTIELNDRVQLYEDATFTIISAELLAGMKVEIYPGKSNQKLNLAHQPFYGKYGGRIVDVGLTIDKLAKDLSSLTFRLDTTTSTLNRLLRKGDLQRDLTSVMSNLNQITEKFKTVPDSLSYTLSQLNHSVKKVNRLIEDNRQPIETSLKDIQKVTKQVDSLSISLKGVLRTIETQQGTLGKMIYDSTLYININKALLSVDSLANRLRKKGLKMSLF
ncbi:MAG: MCE family protein [Calditrichaeota bacterium]|nr:MCE family protein [Calditrichota bacterium]